ncbi:hypothetical protein [Methylomonas koyamae]|uniref:hypothetical protein n=1 Tax=Methylomonas koyamae TaxID=702114 RepID=UPI002873C87E|nr:hypothetical protein [Methylomonas koyamae]WNB74038.1 hypothetical protein RI210_12150 [Methylomonas koyamae]
MIRESLFLSILLLAGCATPPLPKQQLNTLLDSPALNSTFKAELEAQPPASVKHNGPVKVTIQVWTTYSGDGAQPESNPVNPPKPEEGEMYPQWYFKGEKSLKEVRQDEIVRNYASLFDPNKNPLSNPIARDSFILYPADQNLEVVIRIYDQDEIGDQTYKEVSKFLDNVGAQGTNLYPEKQVVIPIFQELGKLIFLDLPNLFLENDSLGTCRFTIIRDKNGVQTSTEWIKENYLLCKVDIEAR